MHRKLLAVCLFAVALAVTAAPAYANQDAVQFFSSIHVTPDSPVHDAVCFFCSVRVEGKVEGDIVVFFGSVRLDGEAHHDIVSFFGGVSAADNSTIGGDLVSFFGSVRLGENVTVAKDVVSIFGSQHMARSVCVGHSRVSLSPWIFFGPLLVIFLVVFLIVHEVRTHSQRQFAQNYPPPPLPR